MLLEHAILQIKPGASKAFETAFQEAQGIISRQKGYLRHELQHCVAQQNQYLLLVWWETLEDHEIGFRGSKDYQKWKKMLHHFYEPFPVVQHYERLF